MAAEEGRLRSAIAVAEWRVGEAGIWLWCHGPGHPGHYGVDEALKTGEERGGGGRGRERRREGGREEEERGRERK